MHKHWLKVIVLSLVMLAGVGVAINLAGCVSDDAHAANVAQAAAQAAKLESLHSIYESRIAEMTARLETLQEDSEEAGDIRSDLEAARVKLAEYAAAGNQLKAAQAAGDKLAENTQSQVQGIAGMIPVPGALAVGGIVGAVLGDQRRRKMLVGLVRAVEVVLKPDPAVAAAFHDKGPVLQAVMGESTSRAVARIRSKTPRTNSGSGTYGQLKNTAATAS